MNKAYVQYGCGLSAPATWRNFDASPSLRLGRIPLFGRLLSGSTRFPDNVEFGDITRGLHVADASCEAIYCSHVLEHLALEECRRALRNTHRLLREGGLFRLVVPDLELEIREYLNSAASDAALSLLRKTHFGQEWRPRGLRNFLAAWLGHSRHLWMWDYKSLAVELQHAGFSSVRRACFGDSSDIHFRDVEDEGRWANALGIECRRGRL